MKRPWKDHESAVPRLSESYLRYRNGEERQLHRKMHLSARSGRGTAEMEEMRKLVRALRAGAKRLVELT
jgi:hypothetical protein